MSGRGCGWVGGLCAVLVLGVAPARAQQERDWFPEDEPVESPERFAFELRAGPYRPDGSAAFDDTFQRFFKNDKGPLVAFEFDWLPIRIPEVALLGVGASAGWAGYNGRALAIVSGVEDESNEDTRLTLFPLAALAVVRVDVLPRKTRIPVVFAGKLGLDFIPWNSSTGSRTAGDGISLGLRWAGQVAIELDFFDVRAARTLDEEYGVNHTFVFAELFGSTADSSIELGDTTWAVGLGAVF